MKLGLLPQKEQDVLVKPICCLDSNYPYKQTFPFTSSSRRAQKIILDHLPAAPLKDTGNLMNPHNLSLKNALPN